MNDKLRIRTLEERLDANTKKLKKLEADIEAMEDSVWQPIETAPKDTRLILMDANTDYKHVYYGEYQTEVDLWCAGICRVNIPTHWMPLPAIPSQLED